VAEVFPPETHSELLPCDDPDDNEFLRKCDYFWIISEWTGSFPNSETREASRSAGARNAPGGSEG